MKKINIIFALAICAAFTGCAPSVVVNQVASGGSGDSAAAAVPATPTGATSAVNNAVDVAAPAVEDAVAGVSDAIGAIDTDTLGAAVEGVTTTVTGLVGGGS